MAKLHELLAVEGSLENQARTCLNDLRQTFEKKHHLFTEKLVTFTGNTEGASPVTEAQSKMETTVRQELAWIARHTTKSLDASFQVALTNTTAKATITLGSLVIEDVPVTALLELEKRLSELLTLFKAIPTLDPAKGFTADSTRGKGFYQAREVRETRTKKASVKVVLYDATPEHPAQVQLVPEDVPVGTIQKQEWSSMLTPAEKGDLLDRTEDLIRAVKQARSRANEAEVDNGAAVGQALIGYLIGDLKP